MSKSNKSVKKIGYPKDFTINDFANSPQTSGRSKKSEACIKNVVKKELEIKERWDCDDDDELELIDTISSQCKKKEKCKKEISDNSGVDYHIDIWFLISEYIRPEDVGIFAVICKSTYAVVQSAQFWKSLYRRYYTKNQFLPELQPENILRHYGLKTAVVRALYAMYPPFKNRTQQALLGINNPDILIGMTCVGFSSKSERRNGKEFLIYYFKFRRKNATSFQTIKTRQCVMDLLNDINANPDQNDCMLLAVSNKQICFTPIIGKTLKSVTVKLSKEYFNSKLELVFGNAFDCFFKGYGLNGDTIVLDPVINLSIINWWHPMYIKCNNVPFTEDQ